MIRLVALLVTLALAAGCGTHKKLSADDYYKEASKAFANENYDVAVSRYKELLDQYPFSEHAEEAELRIAHSQYKSHHYPEAIAAFNDFQRMHPMSAHLPEVYYLLGKSYMDQMTTTDRDQAAAENAHGWFRVVIDRYPGTPYAAKAQRKLAECRRALAEHELYVAAYYFKRDNLRAGENRVKGILENYADTPVATRALAALASAYDGADDDVHEKLARAAFAERRSAEKAAHAGGKQAADGDAAAPGDPPPAALDDPPPDPATARLLADLTARYGPSAPVSTAATAPALIDPAPPKTGTRGDPRYGPRAGATEPLGGY
jgi:outer membrane protein assembly factor BamD